MKMKYSETYDWSARKFWTNFLVWIIGLLIIQIIGWYLKENFADWKYYLGWGMIVISAVLIISNLLTASNRSSWIKNKNKLDYLAKFDQNDVILSIIFKSSLFGLNLEIIPLPRIYRSSEQ